ncbi:MAG: sulfite exporter TauE/SafE family protein [Bacteroidales bacterium]|nr:sulfite exporter TauE/SafE family protein [Bacteroidales bacterium]
MGIIEVLILLLAGFAVGFVNTIAGGATIISLSALMFMGMPLNVANGTHRIAAAFQTMASVAVFARKGVMDFRKGVRLGIPATAGSVLGAILAIEVDEALFSKIVGIVMIFMMLLLIFKPGMWLKPDAALLSKPVSFLQVLIFFALGFYGGFIYIGIGYFLLAALVLNAGYELVRANAIKVLIVLMYVPLSLVVYIWGGMVDYTAGFVLAAGQVTGAYFGARAVVVRGAGFIRWFMIIVILITVARIFGWLDISAWAA